MPLFPCINYSVSFAAAIVLCYHQLASRVILTLVAPAVLCPSTMQIAQISLFFYSCRGCMAVCYLFLNRRLNVLKVYSRVSVLNALAKISKNILERCLGTIF